MNATSYELYVKHGPVPGMIYPLTDKGLTIVTREGETMTIEADSIIPALPLTPNTGLYESLKGKVREIYTVGDCSEPLLIADAVGAGMRVARVI